MSVPSLSPSISPSNPAIDSGQSIQLTASWTATTGSYTIWWYSVPTSTQPCASGTQIYGPNGASSTSSSYSVSPTSSTYYCAKVSDGQQTQYTALTHVTVNPALGNVASYILMNPVHMVASGSWDNPIYLDIGSYSLGAYWTGGTAPYTIRWYSYPGAYACNYGSYTSQSASSPPPSDIVTNADPYYMEPASNAWYCIQIEDSSSAGHMVVNEGGMGREIYPT